MTFFLKFRPRVESAAQFVAILGGIGILVISVVTLIDILLRITINSPVEGVSDITRYTFAVIIASFYPAGLVLGHNVTIKFLGRALGQKAEDWLGVFGALVTFLLIVMFAWKIFVYTVGITRDGQTTLTLEILQAPWWWVVSAIFILCVPTQLFILAEQVCRAIGWHTEPNKPA